MFCFVLFFCAIVFFILTFPKIYQVDFIYLAVKHLPTCFDQASASHCIYRFYLLEHSRLSQCFGLCRLILVHVHICYQNNRVVTCGSLTPLNIFVSHHSNKSKWIQKIFAFASESQQELDLNPKVKLTTKLRLLNLLVTTFNNRLLTAAYQSFLHVFFCYFPRRAKS